MDTSVVIDLEHRRLAGEEVAHLLPSEGVLAAISVAEIWLGIHKAHSARIRRERREFLESIERWLPVVGFGRAEAEAYAQLIATLEANGLKMGDRDAQIAGTALANGFDVMTYNVRDFERVRGLSLAPPPRA